jgi:two-component system, cell cycle response regulator DivK
MTQKTILYIEDNPENRMLVRRVLEIEGYTVVEADSGNAGLAKAETTTPDLVLMDINLPEMDGYELTRRLKLMKHLADIPIVAMTANVMRGDREKTLAAGCDGYIQKPIDVDQLPAQVAHYLQAKKL